MLAERLNRLAGREKIMLLAVATVLLVLVLDFAIIRPIDASCHALDRDIAAERQTLDYQRRVLAMETGVGTAFAGVRDRLGAARPEAEARRDMRGALDTLAQDNDVALLSVKDRDPRRTESFDEYAVDIADFETDEQGLARFLHALMAAPDSYRVTRLKVGLDSTGKRLKGSMTVTRVTLPAPTAAATPPPAESPS